MDNAPFLCAAFSVSLLNSVLLLIIIQISVYKADSNAPVAGLVYKAKSCRFVILLDLLEEDALLREKFIYGLCFTEQEVKVKRAACHVLCCIFFTFDFKTNVHFISGQCFSLIYLYSLNPITVYMGCILVLFI